MDNDPKKLASLYFEGKLSQAEERRLYQFITERAEHEALFRQWEQEWERGHVLTSGEVTLLDQLRVKMRKSESGGRIRRWLGFSAAAAVLAVLSVLTFHRTEVAEAPEQVFTVEAPQGTRSRIKLYDGTQVWLNAGSTLSYTSGFNKTARDIRLSGEAYFEVARNEELPFRVEARGCKLTVLGTKFNVSAYEDDPTVQAALVEGSLRFESSQEGETMTPGDLVTYDCATGQASREQANVAQFCTWIDGIIRYDAVTLPVLLRRLAREYNVGIELCTSAFDTKTFHVSLTDTENIETVFKALGEILPITVERRGNHYYVDRRTKNI